MDWFPSTFRLSSLEDGLKSSCRWSRLRSNFVEISKDSDPPRDNNSRDNNHPFIQLFKRQWLNLFGGKDTYKSMRFVAGRQHCLILLNGLTNSFWSQIHEGRPSRLVRLILIEKKQSDCFLGVCLILPEWIPRLVHARLENKNDSSRKVNDNLKIMTRNPVSSVWRGHGKGPLLLIPAGTQLCDFWFPIGPTQFGVDVFRLLMVILLLA